MKAALDEVKGDLSALKGRVFVGEHQVLDESRYWIIAQSCRR